MSLENKDMHVYLVTVKSSVHQEKSIEYKHRVYGIIVKQPLVQLDAGQEIAQCCHL